MEFLHLLICRQFLFHVQTKNLPPFRKLSSNIWDLFVISLYATNSCPVNIMKSAVTDATMVSQ